MSITYFQAVPTRTITLGRRQGAVAGFVVALGYVAAGWHMNLGDLRSDQLFSQQGIPTLLAGTVGGWLLAPRATRARTRQDWVGVVIRLGAVAMVIGALGIGAALGVDSAARAIQETPDAGLFLVLANVGAGLLWGLFGIVVFGWGVLPFTLTAGLLWALLMARFGGRAGP